MNTPVPHTIQNPEALLDRAGLDSTLSVAADTAIDDAIAMRQAAVAIVAPVLKSGRQEAERRLMVDGHGTACALNLAWIEDQIICALHQIATTRLFPNPAKDERLAVIAVGGYGRATLAPGSDIDLLFLISHKQTPWSEGIIEFILYTLWDVRQKVGHSVRGLDECLRLARSDTTIRTAILEARFICGDAPLHETLARRFRTEVTAGNMRTFVAEKLAERDARHHKAGATRYLVEPDVKDGKGALRDLHTLFWIARYVYGVNTPEELAARGAFTRAELAVFLKCEDFLWAVRCHLHFLAGRGEDRLSFDRQADLAERLHYKAHGGLKNVERFMKHYFIVAKEVGDLTRIFCTSLEARHVTEAPALRDLFGRLRARQPAPPDPAFRLEGGRLALASPEGFNEHPADIIRIFEVADRLGVEIHPEALKKIRTSIGLVRQKVANDPQANAIFLRLLTESDDPETILRWMNEAGVLGRFMPDFGRIVAMMQFNMYHHYTVDEHLIRAVGILKEIDRGALAQDHPLASSIVPTLKGRRALYVAVLLHDIAKGRPEDHSIAGARVAESLCPRLGLSADETETVVWLIRHHLLMSETAQMRDLTDFKTILDFAKIVQSPDRLKLLLILTIVDIRAVGPGVWNGWKGQLLRTLYHEAEPVLSGGHSGLPRKERVAEMQDRFLARHTGADSREPMDAAEAAAYMARHYDAYWLGTDEKRQDSHLAMIRAAKLRNEPVATDVDTDDFTAITELTIHAPDHPRLLSLITGACAAAGANIVGAQIFTTTDGMALDTIRIQREFADADDEYRRARRVADLVHKALIGAVRLSGIVDAIPPAHGRITAFTVVPRVIIDNESSNRHTMIEINGLDRIGLLYRLTEALSRLSLNIVSAQVTTFGEKAIDVFYVTDLTGAKIINTSRHATIEQQLLAVLTPAAPVSSAPGFPPSATASLRQEPA